MIDNARVTCPVITCCAAAPVLPGYVPAGLAELPYVTALDLSSNQLTGNLSAYANALPPSGTPASNNILLNMSHNLLSGRIPEGLKQLPMFNGTTSGPLNGLVYFGPDQV